MKGCDRPCVAPGEYLDIFCEPHREEYRNKQEEEHRRREQELREKAVEEHQERLRLQGVRQQQAREQENLEKQRVEESLRAAASHMTQTLANQGVTLPPK